MRRRRKENGDVGGSGAGDTGEDVPKEGAAEVA